MSSWPPLVGMGATAESLVGVAASWSPLREMDSTAQSLVGAAASCPLLKKVDATAESLVGAAASWPPLVKMGAAKKLLKGTALLLFANEDCDDAQSAPQVSGYGVRRFSMLRLAVPGPRWVRADCAASTALLTSGVASLLPLVLATSWLPMLMIGVAFVLLKRVTASWLQMHW